jgi:hypothetical protein
MPTKVCLLRESAVSPFDMPRISGQRRWRTFCPFRLNEPFNACRFPHEQSA